VQEQRESSHCFSYLSWKKREEEEEEEEEGDGGVGATSPAPASPCNGPQLGLGGRKGRRNPEGGRHGFRLLLSLQETERDGDKEREKKGGREGERASARAWRGGSAAQQPPQQPVAFAPPTRPSPWGSDAGAASAAGWSLGVWDGEGGLPNRLQQHVPLCRSSAREPGRVSLFPEQAPGFPLAAS